MYHQSTIGHNKTFHDIFWIPLFLLRALNIVAHLYSSHKQLVFPRPQTPLVILPLSIRLNFPLTPQYSSLHG